MKVKTRESRNNRKGYRAGMLFGLVFFSIGAGFLLLSAVPDVWDAMRMQDWLQVPAEIMDVDLETNRSDDGSTYKVSARFRYDYNGRFYSSDRVGIVDGSRGDAGDWQLDTYARLKGQGQTTIWVNPADPSEAIFDRELRWSLPGFKLL